ncbi:Uncharacterised protein [Citrobacter koseri]|uniref:Uncharacterized protein n=1 Tax=Citrobacter koseri TaxID=545 RepID=A0A447UGB0_CITKO|nr:Uncharacterised protein [Citrobacter koseri]
MNARHCQEEKSATARGFLSSMMVGSHYGVVSTCFCGAGWEAPGAAGRVSGTLSHGFLFWTDQVEHF